MAKDNSTFKKIQIVPDWVNGHYIQWELDPFFKGERPFNFSLEIADTLDFSDIIAEKKNLGDTFFVVDDTKLRQAWDAVYAYRLVLQTATGKTYRSPAVTTGVEVTDYRKYAMAAEIIRKELLMCRTAGTKALLLKRKSYPSSKSKIAQQNIDPVSGVAISDNKEEDYGVGIDGGYFNPVSCAFYNEATEQDKQLDPTGMGVKETYTTVARFPGYPTMAVRDIICTVDDGHRYSIQAVNNKQFPGTNIVIVQKATLKLIPPTDSVYSIPLNTDDR